MNTQATNSASTRFASVEVFHADGSVSNHADMGAALASTVVPEAVTASLTHEATVAAHWLTIGYAMAALQAMASAYAPTEATSRSFRHARHVAMAAEDHEHSPVRHSHTKAEAQHAADLRSWGVRNGKFSE